MKCSINVPLISLNLVIFLLISGSACGQQKSLSYLDFPPLYKFDDYDSCLTQRHDNLPSTYCMVYAEVKPNNSSPLWHQMMQYYEEYPFRYRHDRLFFGICVKRCNSTGNTMETGKLTEEDVVNNEITDHFSAIHKRPLDKKFRREHHNLIHNCLNDEFQAKYDLNLRTFIEYCEQSKEVMEPEKTHTDPLQGLFYKIIGVIIILNILSTIYDFNLKLQQPEVNQNNDFYKNNLPETVPKLLTSFSICRNYYSLILPHIGVATTDFKFLNGFRSVAMMLALYGHVYFMEYQHVANPEYYEKSASDEYKLMILNLTVAIEIYFVMSGLYLFLKFQEGHYVTPQTSWKQILITYIKFMIFRYTRFLPSIALLLLFNATALTHLQDGPFWRHITEPSRVFSRENGWMNLLMINNFYLKKTASHQTWYIAADCQLFGLYLFVIMLVSKYPHYKKHIYSSLAALSFLIPFLISYFLRLQPCFIIKPESYRYTFFKDMAVHYEIYAPFYTNLFGYLFGILCAEIYLKYTRTDNIRKYFHDHAIYTIVAHFLPVFVVPLIGLGLKLDFQDPSIWSALYAGLHRILYIIFVCGMPLLLMSCKCGWIGYEFCQLPIFRVLAKLSFQVFIWHISILYIIVGYQRQPYYTNDLYFFTQFITLYCLSNAVAFIMVLFVEYPFAQITQALQSRTIDKESKKSS